MNDFAAPARSVAHWNEWFLLGVQMPQITKGNTVMSLGTILLIILVVLLIGALPSWPYSTAWGPYPAGGLGLVLLIVLILVLMGRV
jgi:hypothetical protein